MWLSLVLACSGSGTPSGNVGAPPLIPVADPAPPPEPPPGPLPTIGAADQLVVEFASDDVDGGPIAIGCAKGGVTSDCGAASAGDGWAVGVAPLADPGTDTSVVITAHRVQTVQEQGPQCSWLRVHPAEGSHPTAGKPRPVHPLTELPAVLAAAPPNRAWSLDLDGDGVDEILYEQEERGATNTIGVVKSDGQKVVIWQDEPTGPAGAPVEDGEPVGSMGGSWSTIVGVTDTTLDGKLEVVVDLDRHESLGWTLFAYAPTGATKLASTDCKITGSAPK